VIKLLWLAIRDIEEQRARQCARQRARQRAKEKNVPKTERKAPGKLVEGAVVQGWTRALNALAIAYPGRLPEFV
jgi:putative transposase